MGKPIKKPMTLVVASRRLAWRRADGTVVTVEARIGQPVQDEADENKDWYCPYQIERIVPDAPSGEASETTNTGELLADHAIWGVDSVQALCGALAIVGVELSSLVGASDTSGSIWGDAPNFGFPALPRSA